MDQIIVFASNVLVSSVAVGVIVGVIYVILFSALDW